MCAYAKWQFRAHSTQEGSKISRYDHWKQIEKQTGKPPKELLNEAPLPDGCEDIWTAFLQLKGDYSFQEIEAYTKTTGIILDYWEVQAIIALSNQRATM